MSAKNEQSKISKKQQIKSDSSIIKQFNSILYKKLVHNIYMYMYVQVLNEYTTYKYVCMYMFDEDKV